jgi:hypothetical protein
MVCNQLVIEHPYPAPFLEFWDSEECRIHNNRVHDCRVIDPGENYR